MLSESVVHAACVGHVEYVEFVEVDRLPRSGELVDVRPIMELAAGGGAVAAVQFAALGAKTRLYTALGDDELGHRAVAQLRRQGLDVQVTWRAEPTRRVLSMVHADGERTNIHIGTLAEPNGTDPLPWKDLSDMDCVYFTAGDTEAVIASRRARVLVANPRAQATVKAGIELDALVFSATDTDECVAAKQLTLDARYMVATNGAEGGTYRAGKLQGAWSAAPPNGPIIDAYGCGDVFGAGLAFGLGRGLSIDEALSAAARYSAACLTRRGPYE